MTVPARLLIVDDDPLFTAPVASFLATAGHSVRSRVDADELFGDAIDADLLLLGRPRRHASVLTLVAEVRRRSPLPVIVMGQAANLADRVGALEAGADDFVIKPLSPRELCARVASVLRRSAPRPPRKPVLRFAGWSLDTETRLLTSSNGLAVPLPETDLALLATFLQNPHDASARERLMAHVGGAVQRFEAAEVAPAPRRIRGVSHYLELCD